MSFGSDFTDNPAGPGEGDGESIATFLLGIPDGGTITSVTPNAIYNRQILRRLCSRRLQSESTPHPELGLRYEIFTTIKERPITTPPTSISARNRLIVPSGQRPIDAHFSPPELSHSAHGSRGLISPDTNNFGAPGWTVLSTVRQARSPQRLWHLFMAGRKTGPFSIQARF